MRILRSQVDDKYVRNFFSRHGVPGWEPIDPHFSMSHDEYLLTLLWTKIRRRVLVRDKRKCRLCDTKAQTVHHISYDYDVIVGRRDDDLVSLCNACHAKIEFEHDGRHRTVEEKLAVYLSLKNDP